MCLGRPHLIAPSFLSSSLLIILCCRISYTTAFLWCNSSTHIITHQKPPVTVLPFLNINNLVIIHIVIIHFLIFGFISAKARLRSLLQQRGTVMNTARASSQCEIASDQNLTERTHARTYRYCIVGK